MIPAGEAFKYFFHTLQNFNCFWKMFIFKQYLQTCSVLLALILKPITGDFSLIVNTNGYHAMRFYNLFLCISIAYMSTVKQHCENVSCV